MALYVALSIVVLLGISSLVVDLGIAYQRRSYMQKAADATALAGAAYAVQNTTASTSTIQNATRTFATNNYGYTNGANNTALTVTVTAGAASGNGTIVVGIAKPQPTLFARIFRMKLFTGDAPATFNSTQISTTATAAYETQNTVTTGISGGSDGYGLNSKATANLSLLGPLATTNRGDNRSVYYTSDNNGNTGNVSPNSEYALLNTRIRRPEDERFNDTPTTRPGEVIPKGDGYYFDLSMPSDGSKVSL